MKKRVTNRSPPLCPARRENNQTHFQEDNQMKKETDLIKIKGYANLLLMSERGCKIYCVNSRNMV